MSTQKTYKSSIGGAMAAQMAIKIKGVPYPYRKETEIHEFFFFFFFFFYCHTYIFTYFTKLHYLHHLHYDTQVTHYLHPCSTSRLQFHTLFLLPTLQETSKRNKKQIPKLTCTINWGYNSYFRLLFTSLLTTQEFGQESTYI